MCCLKGGVAGPLKFLDGSNSWCNKFKLRENKYWRYRIRNTTNKSSPVFVWTPFLLITRLRLHRLENKSNIGDFEFATLQKKAHQFLCESLFWWSPGHGYTSQGKSPIMAIPNPQHYKKGLASFCVNAFFAKHQAVATQQGKKSNNGDAESETLQNKARQFCVNACLQKKPSIFVNTVFLLSTRPRLHKPEKKVYCRVVIWQICTAHTRYSFISVAVCNRHIVILSHIHIHKILFCL